MEKAVVTTKGQIVVPVKLRRRFGIKQGTVVGFIEQGNALMIKPLDRDYFTQMSGIAETKGKMLRSLLEDKKTERKR